MQLSYISISNYEDFTELSFTDEGYKVLTSIKEKIKLDLKAMSIIKE